MLRKLMKHEFRATGRVMLPLFLLVLLTSAGANLSTRTLLETDNNFLNILGMLLLSAFVLAIVGACVVPLIMMIQRFYKNLLQDEGYVMMTLPVSTHQHIWSKLLVSMVWFVATALVLTVSFVILVYEIGFVERMFQVIVEILGSLRFGEETVHAAAICVELVVILFFSCTSACLQFYAAMAIGHSFANHKMVLSVAAYFGSQFALQLLGGGFIVLMGTTGMDYMLTQALTRLSGVTASHFMALILIVVSVILAAIFYFLTAYFLKRRLNLE